MEEDEKENESTLWILFLALFVLLPLAIGIVEGLEWAFPNVFNHNVSTSTISIYKEPVIVLADTLHLQYQVLVRPKGSTKRKVLGYFIDSESASAVVFNLSSRDTGKVYEIMKVKNYKPAEDL